MQLYISKKYISTNVFVAGSNVELQVLGQQGSSMSTAAIIAHGIVPRISPLPTTSWFEDQGWSTKFNLINCSSVGVLRLKYLGLVYVLPI